MSDRRRIGDDLGGDLLEQLIDPNALLRKRAIAQVRQNREIKRRQHGLGVQRLFKIPQEGSQQISRALYFIVAESETGHCGLRMAMPRSRNWRSGTELGASHIRSVPRAVLGNGMTSRIEVSPARIITSRSRPSAMPPCGGAPYSSASNKNPNRWRASSY